MAEAQNDAYTSAFIRMSKKKKVSVSISEQREYSIHVNMSQSPEWLTDWLLS